MNFEDKSLEANNKFIKQLLEEDLNDPELGWRQSMVQREKDGF
jgi:hypothetical protein